MNNTIVLSIFHNKAESDEAVEDLKDNGVDSEDISVVFKGHRVPSSIKETTAGGATTGGIIGGIAGLLVGIGAITIPGIGAVLIAGPLAASLGATGAAVASAAATAIAGGVTGAIAGGLVGALVGLGLTEDEAQKYESEIKEGGILLAVNTEKEREATIKNILVNHHAEEIKTIDTKPRVGEKVM